MESEHRGDERAKFLVCKFIISEFVSNPRCGLYAAAQASWQLGMDDTKC